MSTENESTAFVGSFGSLSRELMAGMLDQSEDCVKILDPHGRITFMNANGRCVMEIDDFTAFAGKAWDTLWPVESSEQVRAAIDDARSGRASRFEAFCPTAKGTPKWWEVTVTGVRQPDGTPFAIMAVSRDVTERRRTSESLATMSQEMQHRLRNAFAISSAIALTSARAEPEHREFAQSLAQRYNALSLVQARLIEAGGANALGDLVREIVDGFDSAQRSVTVGDIPEVMLSDEQVRFIALVLGELSTNSIKHGALKAGLPVAISGSREDGTVELQWRETLDGAAGRSGSDAVAKPDGGRGNGLMQRMAQAHGAKLDVSLGVDLLEAKLSFPAPK